MPFVGEWKDRTNGVSRWFQLLYQGKVIDPDATVAADKFPRGDGWLVVLTTV